MAVLCVPHGARAEGRWGGAETFAEMCSSSEAGSYLRRIDFVYRSTLGSRVIKKKKRGGQRLSLELFADLSEPVGTDHHFPSEEGTSCNILGDFSSRQGQKLAVTV